MTDLSECPGCKQTVDIFGQNEYKCALCVCGIVWCTECKKEPHWPMNCEMAAEWTRRWKHHSLSDDDQSQRLREITCSCLGPPIVVGESERFAKCNNCNIAFDPHTMQVLSKGGRPSYKMEKFVVVEDRILPNLYVPRIKKEVVKICEKARNYRFETTKLNELEKSRKLNDSVAGVEKLRDIRKMVLYIIEYGMAWIHMEKSIADRALIKTNLVQLLRQYEELVTIIDYQRPKFAESVEALNTFAQKTIDLIKKHL